MGGKRNKAIFSLGILFFFLLGLFGFSHSTMGIASDGEMSGCPFNLGSVVCTMSPLEHVSALQNLFNMLPSDISTFTLILLLLAFSHVISFAKSPPPKLFAYNNILNRKYIAPAYFLQYAFSDGILNSKTF
jgi:hypothetical protein